MSLYGDCSICDGLFEMEVLRLYYGDPVCSGCIELEGEDWQDHPPVTADDLEPLEDEA